MTQILAQYCCFSAAGAVSQGCLGIGLALVVGPALVAIDPGFAQGERLGIEQHKGQTRRHGDQPARCRIPVGQGPAPSPRQLPKGAPQ